MCAVSEPSQPCPDISGCHWGVGSPLWIPLGRKLGTEGPSCAALPRGGLRKATQSRDPLPCPEPDLGQEPGASAYSILTTPSGGLL